MAIAKGASQKPIARVKGKVSASIYRGRFKKAEHLSYLDVRALNRAKKALIEVGSVHAAGVSVPLVAEVRKGMVVKLRPTHCTTCKPSGRKSSTGSQRQKTAKAALQKVRDLGLHSVRLPMSIARLRGGLFGLPIWILIDWEICLVIELDDRICYFCTSSGVFCISTSPNP